MYEVPCCPPSRTTAWWGQPGKKGFRNQIGFPDLVMHELRHTQATQLLGNGVDIKTVQHRLGHAKASLTLDMYAHAIPANDREAAAIMGGLTGTAARKEAGIISIEEYEARIKRRKKRVAERKARTHGRRERAAS